MSDIPVYMLVNLIIEDAEEYRAPSQENLKP
jgi:hypothetical protein